MPLEYQIALSIWRLAEYYYGPVAQKQIPFFQKERYASKKQRLERRLGCWVVVAFRISCGELL